MARCSSKSDELRDINSMECRARNIAIEKWEIDIFKIEIVTFIVNFGRQFHLKWTNASLKNAASVSEVLAFLVGALNGIFDLPYCQIKLYLCLRYHPNIWM